METFQITKPRSEAITINVVLWFVFLDEADSQKDMLCFAP
jgi:hypothetical protein